MAETSPLSEVPPDVDPDFLKYMATQKFNGNPIPVLCNVVTLATCNEGFSPHQCQCKGCLQSFACRVRGALLKDGSKSYKWDTLKNHLKQCDELKKKLSAVKKAEGILERVATLHELVELYVKPGAILRRDP